MRMRLMLKKRPPAAREVPEPRSAMKILDDPRWHEVEPYESVRLVPVDAPTSPVPAPAPDEAPAPPGAEVITLPRAGYRWGSPVAVSTNLPAVRFERAVVALANRSEMIAAHVHRIVTRLDGLADQLFDAANQSDLIELESRRARLAAEVARLAVELRAELDRRLNDLARSGTAGATRSADVLGGDRLGPLDRADALRFELQLEHGSTFDRRSA